MIISNNALKLFDKLPSNIIIRINVAWCKTLNELKTIVENSTHPIYLDCPTGRLKPPITKIKLSSVIKIANKSHRVKYFACSNAEDHLKIKELRNLINDRIQLVPKIETVKGIKNMVKICNYGMTDMIMLDHEDLYINVNHNNKLFNKYMNIVIQKGKKHKIKIYKVQGIIFDEIKS